MFMEKDAARKAEINKKLHEVICPQTFGEENVA